MCVFLHVISHLFQFYYLVVLFGVCLLPILWPCCVIYLAVHELGCIRVKFNVFISKTISNIPVGFCAGAGVPRSRNYGLFALCIMVL